MLIMRTGQYAFCNSYSIASFLQNHVNEKNKLFNKINTPIEKSVQQYIVVHIIIPPRASLKPFWLIAPNWVRCLRGAKHWSYLISAVQVHTTTHCRFYREHYWAIHLIKPTLIPPSVFFFQIVENKIKSTEPRYLLFFLKYIKKY